MATGIFQKYYQEEDAAREHLEKLLWPNVLSGISSTTVAN